MNHLPISIPIEIPETADGLYQVSSSVLEKLRSYGVHNAGLLRKVRLVLIEMATNFLKHVTDARARMLVTLDVEQLTICKTYTGSPLRFFCEEAGFPFPAGTTELHISFGKNNNHLIAVQGPYSFRFLNPLVDETSIELLPESYGLSIITHASERFVYAYEPQTHRNEFMAVLNITGS
ncbi:hypothetical protein C7T94_12390 [Pedobacter yulinensis]|uniref:Anti-sigma regulatory factor n=1 Tax=Pedobacter yulinensis TaxID=2126353 RepID=A0A2T3HLR4_9SPHI|nr:hypothetical protein [Pedobacter yulinensis]PST83369.1 hypothetical protein C7T94_12390 [Pedobacter yulinensis]